MAPSTRFTSSDRPGGLLKRTALYVASFGVGSLLIAGLLSLMLVSVAEGVLPARDAADQPRESDTDAPAATTKPTIRPPARKSPPRRAGKPAQRPTGASGLRGAATPRGGAVQL